MAETRSSRRVAASVTESWRPVACPPRGDRIHGPPPHRRERHLLTRPHKATPIEVSRMT
ncbi:hypothetical protein BJY54_001110 [Streptomyces nodosus]|nr:hypothetical protein [Streptomyces nodosus]